MSFPKYPAYKDSGVEWLGEVPEHWVVKQLRYLGRFRKGLTITKADLADTGIPCLNYGEVHSLYPFEVNQDIQPLKCVPDEFLKTNPSASVKYGDFVFADTSEDLDGVGNFTHVSGVEPLFAGYHTIIYSLDSAVSSRFLAYCLNSFAFRTQLRLSVKGVKVFSVTQEILRGGTVWLPTTAEQTQIARFLDHETARIDALIEEQQRLIELLKEKRQAVISHAVTKGLDPTVQMKDSGVEWLGEVPAHWDVRKLKSLVSVRGGSTPSKEVERYWGGDIPWVSPKDMKSERIRDSIDHVSDLAIQEGGLSIVKSGSVLIVVRGMILVHSVPVAITDVDVTINQDMKAMTPSEKMSCDYLLLLLQGVRDAVFQYIDSSAHGTRKLEWERFELFELPIPPRHEQIEIAVFIEKQKQAIDDLAEQAASAINFMKERRSALITAAVTGKIDVRNWQPPASIQAPEAEQEAV